MINEILSSNIFTWAIMPLLIILARMLDVSFGTLRFVFISKNKKLFAALAGFMESFVWIMVVGKLLNGSTNIIWLVAYAVGFGIGTYLGLLLSEKMAIGKVMLRVITRREPKRLIAKLISKNYSFTIVDSKNQKGNITKVLLLSLEAKELNIILHYIKKFNPKAFYSVEEVKSMKENNIKQTRPSVIKSFLMSPMRRFR